MHAVGNELAPQGEGAEHAATVPNLEVVPDSTTAPRSAMHVSLPRQRSEPALIGSGARCVRP